MFAKSNDVMTSTKVSEVQSVGNAHRDEQGKLKTKNTEAVTAGDTLGGDFSDSHGEVKK